MAQNVSRRDFLGAVSSAAVGLSMMSVTAAEPKPNLLFILTDQHRQDGVGCYGKKGIITPNLDRLASDGMRFDRAYTAQPVCAPNRGAIVSGLYPHNHGVLENTWDLNPKIPLLPDFLKSMGYAVPEGLDGLNLSDSIRQGGKTGREALVMVNTPFIDKKRGRPNQPDLAKGEERCVVSGDWKLILSTVRKPELYHLPSDPGERQNRWQEMASSETAANLKTHLQAWAHKTRDKLAPSLLAKI